ncbi:MAG TPA: hypothetical protein VD816_05815 [Ohtaekwangia sp.]|nr:hypothetical protein [Ohtaekwangia sp.]
MKLSIALVAALLICSKAFPQEIQTVFRPTHASGGYGALTNKFTTIRGEYANIAGVYGGWFVNHRFLIGLGAAAVTNDIRVPAEFSANPGKRMSYEYGQAGMVMEYVVGSNKAIHLVFHAFTGAGFTVQYERYNHGDDYSPWGDDLDPDENWFFVAEPGMQVEVNIFRWMRLSPGVSYRLAYGSDGKGMTDGDLRDMTYNVTLKFGKF